MRFPHRRSLSVIAALSVGAGMLLSAGAAQADVYANGTFTPTYRTSGGSCPSTVSATGATPNGQTVVPFSVGAGPATHTASVHTVSTNSSDPNDTLTQDLSDTTTVELTSAGGSIAAMHLASTGFVHSTTSLSTSGCTPLDVRVTNAVGFDFTVTTPGYFNYTFAINGPVYGYFYFQGEDDLETYGYVDGEYNNLTSTNSVYLVPGDYSGYYAGRPYVTTTTSPNLAGATSVKVDATFTPDGTPAPPTPPTISTPKGLLATPTVGKALGYTSLPLARSCSTGTLVANVTSSKKAAKSIKKVTVSVDGAPALTVKHPKAGQALTVPVADNGKARAVKTKVTMKKKDQKKAKSYSSSAVYQPCG